MKLYIKYIILYEFKNNCYRIDLRLRKEDYNK